MPPHLLAKISQTLRALMTRRITIKSDLITYEFEQVPLKKILNAVLVETSLLFKTERAWGWPTHLMMEPTTHCNLRCALCPITTGLERPQGHMSIETFRGVIDEIGEYVFLLLLWDWGEPFLNPSIYEMIAYARRKGIKVVSSTNGHIFANAEQADRLIESGIDSIIFAVDGISQETYEHYRQGGSLETVLRGIQTVVARKKELRSKTPFINFRFIVMEHNEHEIPHLVDLAKSLGVDALTLKTLNPASQDPYFEGQIKTHDEFLPQSPRYRRFQYEAKDDGQRVRLRRNPCRELWNGSMIHWSGKVCPCTYDPKDRYVLGDLKKETFRQIWASVSYRRMRHDFRRTWGSGIPICRQCSYAYKGGDCSRESIAEAYFFDAK